MITAVETTPGSIAENKRLLALVEQHEANTGQAVQTSAAPARPLEYELAVHAHEEAPDVDAERAGQAVHAEPAAAAE